MNINSIKTYVGRDGYLKTGNTSFHRVVWEHHFGKIPKGYEIHHIDKNKKNNSIDNLMLVTPFEHKKIHGGSRLIDGEWFKICRDCKIEKNEKNDFYSNERQVYFVCKDCWAVRSSAIVEKRKKSIAGDSGKKLVKSNNKKGLTKSNVYLLTQEEFDMKLMNAFLYNGVWSKKCTRCNEIKTLSDMEKRGNTKSGIGSLCKICKKEKIPK